jgi:hypothetical protein
MHFCGDVVDGVAARPGLPSFGQYVARARPQQRRKSYSPSMCHSERGFGVVFFWRIATGGAMPRSHHIRLLHALQKLPRYMPRAIPHSALALRRNGVEASEDFPRADTPVITVSWSCGYRAITFFRL